MSKYLAPMAVATGVVEELRDWKAWLTPLDDIPLDGISGLCYKGSCHWFCYTRRCDLPLDVADYVKVEPCDLPNDVVVMVKEYMSSDCLAQPVFKFCRASATCSLPQCPQDWLSRIPFTPEYIANLNTLVQKVNTHFHDKGTATEYLQTWVSKPLKPSFPPECPAILKYTCGQRAGTVPIGPALAAAAASDKTGPRLVQVKRRRVAEPARGPINLPLHSYVAFRRSQGVDESDAATEWAGAQAVMHLGGASSA